MPQGGLDTLGKPPWGSYNVLFEIELKLLFLQLLLVAYVSPYRLFVQTYGPNTIPPGPEMHPSGPFCLENTSVDLYSALTFQKSDYKSNAELRRNAQTHMDVARH